MEKTPLPVVQGVWVSEGRGHSWLWKEGAEECSPVRLPRLWVALEGRGRGHRSGLVLLPPRSPGPRKYIPRSLHRVESMQVDRTPSPTRKVSTPAPCAASPTRSFCGFSVRQETGGHRPPWGLLDECWPSSERVGWLAGRVLKTVAGAPPPQAEPDRQAGGRERCWVVRTNHHPPSQLRNPGEEPTGNSGGELSSFPV